MIAPVLFTTISVAIFKQKVWSKSELVVKSYIKLVAALTFVRFVSLVTSAVRLEVRQLREGLGAT